jgi:hypothetical protein
MRQHVREFESVRLVKVGVAPVLRVSAGFVIARSLTVAVLFCTRRQIVGSSSFNVAKAAIFVGVGHWLHHTPPIFPIG